MGSLGIDHKKTKRSYDNLAFYQETAKRINQRVIKGYYPKYNLSKIKPIKFSDVQKQKQKQKISQSRINDIKRFMEATGINEYIKLMLSYDHINTDVLAGKVKNKYMSSIDNEEGYSSSQKEIYKMLAGYSIDRSVEDYVKNKFIKKLTEEDIPMYFMRYLTYDQMEYISRFHIASLGKKLYERDRHFIANKTDTKASEELYPDLGKLEYADNHKGTKVTIALYNNSKERQLFTKALQQFSPKFILDAAKHYASADQSMIFADAIKTFTKDYSELPIEYKVN